MAIVKSKLLKKIFEQHPNFFQKDIEKFFSILLDEIKSALKRGERVEFRRNLGTFSTKTQKASTRRNPKTGEQVHVKEKKIIRFKMSQELFNKINKKND